jgi:hypothetical protein
VIASYGSSSFVLLVRGDLRDPLSCRVRMFNRSLPRVFPETGIGPLALCNGYLTDPPADVVCDAVVREAAALLAT